MNNNNGTDKKHNAVQHIVTLSLKYKGKLLCDNIHC